MKTKLKKRYKKIVHALIIGIAVVLFWRGVWGIADKILFPHNYFLSSITSVIIALTILYFTKHLIKGLL